eukprot:m.366638 g.366638  ORF g.366638 m.366638 type:complete len:51 (+) comp36961_c0_seq1:94-246(+)
MPCFAFASYIYCFDVSACKHLQTLLHLHFPFLFYVFFVFFSLVTFTPLTH